MTPRVLTRPYVGLRPTVPQKADGIRIEPPVSDPRAAEHMPADTGAADPPEDPPATSGRFHGLWTAPKWLSAEVPPNANSCRFCLPTITAPAALRRRTTSASSAGTRSAKNALAAVVFTFAVSNKSFR